MHALYRYVTSTMLRLRRDSPIGPKIVIVIREPRALKICPDPDSGDHNSSRSRSRHRDKGFTDGGTIVRCQNCWYNSHLMSNGPIVHILREIKQIYRADTENQERWSSTNYHIFTVENTRHRQRFIVRLSACTSKRFGRNSDYTLVTNGSGRPRVILYV